MRTDGLPASCACEFLKGKSLENRDGSQWKPARSRNVNLDLANQEWLPGVKDNWTAFAVGREQ